MSEEVNIEDIRAGLDEDLIKRVHSRYGKDTKNILNRAVNYYMTRYSGKMQTTMPLSQEDINFLRVYCAYTGKKRTEVMAGLIEKAPLPKKQKERLGRLYSSKPKPQSVSFNIDPHLWTKLDKMAKGLCASKALVMERLLAKLREDLKDTMEGRVIADMQTRQERKAS